MADHRAILMILNPVAGRGRAKRTIQKVIERLKEHGCAIEVRQTAGPGDAENLARAFATARRDGPSCVVACGGDGTVQEIANALADLGPELGDRCPALALAPSGRCNDFAHVLGVARDPDSISQTLLTGRRTAIDLGRANGRYFCTVLTTGIDAEISRYVDESRLPLSGTPAYLLATFIVLARYRPKRLRIEGDFGVIEQSVFIASTANTSLYGGSVPIAPVADPTDGLLDLCVIDGMVLSKAVAMIPRILRGRHVGHPKVRFERSQCIRIQADDPIEVWADGQRIARTPVTIEAAAGAIQVLTPTPTAGPPPTP